MEASVMLRMELNERSKVPLYIQSFDGQYPGASF